MGMIHIRDLSNIQFGTSGVRALNIHLDFTACYAYASAFLQTTVANSDTVLIGMDCRPNSLDMAQAVARAVLDQGMRVRYAGILPTPALAAYALAHNLPAIMITGSHIPFDRNGIKFYRPDGEISKADEAAISAASINLPSDAEKISLPPLDDAPRTHYIKRYRDFFADCGLAGKTVAIYEHSSAARDLLHDICHALDIHTIALARSAQFVALDTEAIKAEDQHQCQQWAQQHDFDMIVSTDGDGDRPLIGSEQGQWLRGDLIGILTSKFIQPEHLVTPINVSSDVEHIAGTSVTRTKIGSPYVIAGMAQCQGSVVCGFEANGGYLLGSDLQRNGRTLKALPTRDAVLPMLAILAQSVATQQPLSLLAAQVNRHPTASARLQNIPTERATACLNYLETQREHLGSLLRGQPELTVNHLSRADGLRISFTDHSILHFRASGNAPELRCYSEASSIATAHALCQQGIDWLTDYFASSGH